MQSLPLTSQPERKNKKNTPECDLTSLEEKYHYYTVHPENQSISFTTIESINSYATQRPGAQDWLF